MEAAFVDERDGSCDRIAQVTPAKIFEAIAM